MHCSTNVIHLCCSLAPPLYASSVCCWAWAICYLSCVFLALVAAAAVGVAFPVAVAVAVAGDFNCICEAAALGSPQACSKGGRKGLRLRLRLLQLTRSIGRKTAKYNTCISPGCSPAAARAARAARGHTLCSWLKCFLNGCSYVSMQMKVKYL